MIRRTQPDSLAREGLPSRRPTVKPPRPLTSSTAYDAAFWYSYGANTLVMTAISVLFRYADFVSFLGGTEFNLGWIVGIGMVGSLVMRLLQGVGIDQYGPRRVWLWSAALFVICCLAHLTVRSVTGPWIFILRVVFNTSVAGLFGASITYISRRAPTQRLAEVIGTLGTSGFVGMVLGTVLGDWLFNSSLSQSQQLQGMFLLAAALGALSFWMARRATRGQLPPIRRRQQPLGYLVRRYHPGAVLAVGIVMGFGLGLPHTFLRPFAAELGIGRIAWFFTVYATAAFVTRLAMRRLPDRLGSRPTILVGLSCLTVAMLLYLVVQSEWQLAIPALLQGIAHAFLFPSVIAAGSAAFPDRYRGLATTLMLAMFDLGNLVGAPAIGGILRFAGHSGLPRYPTMFICVAVVIGVVGALYYLVSRVSGSGDNPRNGRLIRRYNRTSQQQRMRPLIAAAPRSQELHPREHQQTKR